MNLILSPTAGILSETTFSIYLLSKYISENKFNRLYYKYNINGNENTIEINNINYKSENEIIFKIEIANEKLDSLPNPLRIQVFGEVTNINGKKENLSNEINLYTNKQSLDFNELISSVLNSYEDINNLTAEDKGNLVAILDGLNSFNERIRVDNQKTFSVPIVNDDGYLVYEEPVCPKNYCNGNGECVFIEANEYCYCYEGFAGKRCQFTERNHNLLKNYFKSITNDLIANEVYKSNNNTNNNNIILIHNHIKSTENLLEEIEDLNNYVLILENLLNVNKNSECYSNNDLNSSLIVSIINNILSLTEQNIIKTKIDNYEMKLNKRIIVNYKKSSQVNLANPFVTNNSNNKHSNTNNSTHTHTHRNQTRNNKSKTKERYLSKLNDDAEDNITENSFDKFEFSLNDSQLKNFNTEISKIKNSLVQFANEILNSRNSSDVLKFSNDNFDIQAYKISLDNIINFNLQNLFVDRKIRKNSYFDLVFEAEGLSEIANNRYDTKAINEFKNKLIEKLNWNNIDLDKCLGKINLIYIYNKNPSFNLGFSITNNSLTSSHIIEFFDCNLNKIDFSKLLDQNQFLKVTHYLPVITKNKEFINNFNLNPEKYLVYQENFEEIISPLFVFPNGTIDRNPDLDYQIKKYHSNYLVRFLNEKYSYRAKSISKSGYLIANTKTTGEFFSTIEPSKATRLDSNIFFLKYPQIFTSKENYINNKCLFALVLLFCLNLLLVFFSSIFTKAFERNYTGANGYFEKEKSTMLNDEAIFRQYFVDMDSKSEEISILRYNSLAISLDKNLNDTSKDCTDSQNVNNNSNKAFEQSKISMPNISIRNNVNNKNHDSENQQIELNITNDLENTNNLKEVKTQEINYTVVKNLANLDLLDNTDKASTVVNKKNNEEVNRIIADDSVENKKAYTFKNKSIKLKMEGKNMNPPAEVLENNEFGSNVISKNNQNRCCSARLRTFLFFVFQRNIYSSFAFVVSVFNPRRNHITKVFTLVYLLSSFTAFFVGLSGINFNVINFFFILFLCNFFFFYYYKIQEDKYSLFLIFPVVISVIISNMIFSLININYSSIYENKNSSSIYNKKNIQEVIDSDFSKEKM